MLPVEVARASSEGPLWAISGSALGRWPRCSSISGYGRRAGPSGRTGRTWSRQLRILLTPLAGGRGQGDEAARWVAGSCCARMLVAWAGQMRARPSGRGGGTV